jgi:hypothetical protein
VKKDKSEKQERNPTSGAIQLHGYTVHHKHGEDVLMGCTPDESKQYLYDYVCQWWDELDRVDEDGEDVPVPEDQDEAISEYFDSENGAYEEYAEEASPIVDPTYGMEVFITSDSLHEKHTLTIKFTSEGMIFDYINEKGEIVKTMSRMYNEIVEDWML